MDTMILSMSPRARYTQKAPKILKIMTVKGSKGGLLELTFLLMGPLLKLGGSCPIKAWWSCPNPGGCTYRFYAGAAVETPSDGVLSEA